MMRAIPTTIFLLAVSVNARPTPFTESYLSSATAQDALVSKNPIGLDLASQDEVKKRMAEVCLANECMVVFAHINQPIQSR